MRRLDYVSRAVWSAVTLRRPRGARVHPLFDADWYSAAYPDVPAGRFDPWRHYRHHGAREGRKPNEWFDVRQYLEFNADVPRDPLAALDHYLLDGALEGRDPGPEFLSLWYLHENPDVAAAGMNPLLHYLRVGRQEGRKRKPDRLLEAPAAPLVSVIMTTFDSEDHVGEAIDSLLAQSLGDFELIVVDDASQDETVRVVGEYARSDERIRPFASLRNHGTYWCKNFGLLKAKGEFVTFQDSDDRSEPERLARQVDALRQHAEAQMASVDYVRVDEAGHVHLNRGLAQRRALVALMIRRENVISRIGFFDAVRTSADQEYLDRFLAVFGAQALVDLGAPLYKALVREDSLTGGQGGNAVKLEAGSLGENDLSFLSPERQAYVRGYREWHRAMAAGGEQLRLEFPSRTRPFPVPAALEAGTRTALDATAMPGRGHRAEWTVVGCHEDDAVHGTVDHEVVILSDFCFPGGTSHANAAEIEALAQAGHVAALCQVDSSVLKGTQPLHPKIQALTRDGRATWLQPGDQVECRLLLVRHPSVIVQLDRLRARIEADRVIVIVNQVPVDRDGTRHYDVLECQSSMKQTFGTIGTWYPISPTVRDALSAAGIEGVAPDDWHEVIDVTAWATHRSALLTDRRPVIGRHSRPSPGKWPADASTMRMVYPTDGSMIVKVLGGADPAVKILGELPESWVVHEFGQRQPREFLQELDFFVYFHHPDLIEAFGRTVLEALASGLPVILPRHFEPTFGEAAIYADPHEVQGIIRRLWADREAYERQSTKGIEYVRREFSYATHVERVSRLLAPVDVGGDATVPVMS